MNGDGQSAHVSVFGSTRCSTPACAEATPCGSVGNTSAMTLQRYDRKERRLDRCDNSDPAGVGGDGARGHAAIRRSLPVRAAGLSPKNHLATSFATPAVRPVCPVLHMGCARSRRLAQRTMAQLFRSLKQSSDGPAVGWPRTTRGPPIAGDLPSEQVHKLFER
jgi:hypothetical protein